LLKSIYKIWSLFKVSLKSENSLGVIYKKNCGIRKMSSSWSIQAPTLVGSNYDFWSEKVKAILQGQGCWDCVETGFIELDAKVVAAMTVVQRKTLEEL
jgi:hypothetical protein